MDSFPGMETFHEAPLPTHNEVVPTVQILPRPPLWTKRPVKACFGVSFKMTFFIGYFTFNNIYAFVYSLVVN